MSSWLRLLDLPPASGSRVQLMLACSALYGLTRATYLAAANALFVVEFGSEGYPWTYVAAAVVVPALAGLVRQAQVRWSVGVYLSALFGVLLVPVMLFRAALAVTHAPALLFSVLLFNEVIFAFGSAAFWGLAGRLFDVREAKRVFGLIGSGEVAATIAAAAALPWLIGMVGTANLLWLSAFGIAGCLVCVQVAIRAFGERLSSADEGATTSPRERGGGRRPYIGFIFAISVLNTFVFYLADMMFYATVETRFDGADEVGRFLGLFLAATGVATLVARMLSGRLLAWLGVGAALVGEPLLVGALAVVVIVVDGSSSWWALALLGIKFAERLTLDAFTKPAMQVLYQPLPPAVRLRAQATSATVVDQVAGGVVGALLLLSLTVGDMNPRWLAGALFVVCAGWWIAARAASAGYRGTLASSLTARFVGARQRRGLDRDARDALLHAVERDDARQAIVALESLLEASDHRTRRQALASALSHADRGVRLSALGDGHDDALRAHLATLERLVIEDPDAGIRAAALVVLDRVGDAPSETLNAHLASRDTAVADAAAARLLLRQPDHGGARAHLEALARSAHDEELIRAAKLVTEVARPGLSGVLQPLERRWSEANTASRSAALVAAWAALAASGDDASLARLVTMLSIPGTARESAVAALAALGVEARNAVLELAQAASADVETRRAAVRVLTVVDDPVVHQQVADLIVVQPRLRDEALSAWASRSTTASDAVLADCQDRLGVLYVEEQRLATSLVRAAQVVASSGDTDTDVDTARLRRSLGWERQACALRLLRLSTFLHPGLGLEAAVGAVLAGASEAKAYALELLESALPRGEARALTQLIEPPADQPPDDEAVEHLAVWAAALEPWTRASMGAWLAGRDTDVPDELVNNDEVQSLLLQMGQGGGDLAAVDVVMAAPCFAGAPPRVLTAVAEGCVSRAVQAGGVLVELGGDDHSLYLVKAGRLEVVVDGHVVHHLGVGAIVGELAPLVSAPRSATVRATSAAAVLELTRTQLHAALEASPALSVAMARVLARRLREAS